MSIETIPAGASVVITDHEKHREHRDHHPDRWDLANQAERNFDQMVEDVKESATATALAAATNTAAVKDAVVHGTEEARKEYDRLQKQVSDAATSVVSGFKDAATTAYQLSGQSLLEAAKNAAAMSVQSQKESDSLYGQANANFNLTGVQATTNFNALSVQAVLNASAGTLQAEKIAAAAALQAQMLAAAAAAKAAECCCELRTAITFDGQKTRDLINSITEQNLRDRAGRAESALAAYFTAKVAPTAPTAG